jgi:hypothetical protein
MPSVKSSTKKTAKASQLKEKHYDVHFPNPKGVPAVWFDQFSMEETSSHLVVKLGCSIGDNVFAFALSKAEMKNQSFNFGPYVEQLRAFVVDQEVAVSKVKRISSSQSASFVHSIRYIRAGRVNSDGELVLYTFSTMALLNTDGSNDDSTQAKIEAEPVAVLHANLNAHYALVLELLPFTKEGQS